MCRYLQKWGLIKWSYICLCTKHPPFKTLYTSTVYSGKVLKCLLQILCISMSQLEGTDVTHWPMSRYCHITQHPHHTPRPRPRSRPHCRHSHGSHGRGGETVVTGSGFINSTNTARRGGDWWHGWSLHILQCFTITHTLRWCWRLASIN